MPLTNTATIVGNVTDEPSLRFTPSGSPVVNLTVASTGGGSSSARSAG